MSQDPPVSDQQKRAALSRDLSEFLIELSIGVHRYAMYPPDHPSLGPVAENIIGRLSQLFMDRRTLSIGVAHAQLVIEGIATDEKHPVLSDLARRLHGHQLGAVSFMKGTVVTEVEGLLGTLAQDPERSTDPLGSLPADQIPSWRHISLYPLGYDQLEMKDSGETEEEPDRATQLWIGLAQAALATDEPVDSKAATDVDTVAKSIREHTRESAYDQVIVGYLLQLAEELKAGATGEAEVVRQRVSGLINRLDDSTLERLVEMGGDFSQRRQFLLDANQSLAVDSVMKILEAAAATSEQTISTSMTRLLTKLAVHAETGTARLRSQADTALRDNVEDLIRDWELVDPNPDMYTLVLDAMSQSHPVFAATSSEDHLAGANRLVQMALEVDALGPTVKRAVSDLMEDGEINYLLGLIDEAPPDRAVAQELRDYITSPDQFRRLLSGDDVDTATLRSVVARMGDTSIHPLMDALANSESRAIRRKVFDVLAGMGSKIGEAVMDRLEESRWFVLRNMLALVQQLDEVPEGFDPAAFMAHKDPRVRREAFPLALRAPVGRVRTLAAGLSDLDERMARMALVEIQKEGGLQETLLPTLVNRVIQGDRPPEIRALGLRTLEVTKSTLARDALMHAAVGGKSLFGRIKLPPKTQELLTALSVLHSNWRGDPQVTKVLAVASRSKDPEIRAAATGERKS